MSESIGDRHGEDATAASPTPPAGMMKLFGTGVVTGAADDDPSAITTSASAGAQFGFAFLWIAPVLLPMMYVVTYLSAKIGQVYGKGLCACIRDEFPRWVLYPMVALAFAINMIEAAADLGGIGAALNLLVPLPVPVIVVGAAACIVGIQLSGSYQVIRRVFSWLALALFAYVAAAILALPIRWRSCRPHLCQASHWAPRLWPSSWRVSEPRCQPMFRLGSRTRKSKSGSPSAGGQSGSAKVRPGLR
ncbi:Mn2+/Fe2+ NRAMP family transporter [Sphingomonas zeicaulis]|uniref:NRAMP family divalent metal transporter n=1 Tax=Sphingomonas zeicaulis TaxID=1632740 RepID=UPI003D2612E9